MGNTTSYQPVSHEHEGIEIIPFKEKGHVSNHQKLCGITNWSLKGFEFVQPIKNHLLCEATYGHLTRPCTHVHVVPTSFEKYGKSRLFYHDSCLTIYCHVKIPKMFIFDDVCRMFSPRGKSLLKCCTYHKGSRRGFKEICIIATRNRPSRDQLEALRKPHRLVLSVDLVENLFLSCP